MTSKYRQGAILGTGTYGDVFEAHRKSDNLKVAIKRIKPDIDASFSGVNFTALREVKSLREVSAHPNIVRLVEVFISGQVFHLVLEHCPYDLSKIIQDKSIFITSENVKSYLQMVLRGLRCLHGKAKAQRFYF